VSSDTATVSSDVETINVEEEEEDAKLPNVVTVPPAKTPRKVAEEERSRLGADVLGDTRSQKRATRAPPEPVKAGLKSSSK
jgi:hypothetical protein